MKTVTLISKSDCPLCDTAKAAILNVQKKVPFALKEKKITPESPEFETYHERIPVVLIDEKFAFQYKVSELQLLNLLNKKDF
jgi:glutaredoxin